MNAHTPLAINAAPSGGANLTARCARINGSAVLEEGLVLSINDPRSFGRTALFVGGFYVLCGNGKDTPYMHPINQDQALTRKAMIEWRQKAGGREIPILVAPAGDRLPLLLHVNPMLSLPKGVRLRETFYAGVQSNAKLIVSDANEKLFAFTDDDQGATIFYEDGRVTHVARKNNAFFVPELSADEQGELRRNRVAYELQAAREIQDPQHQFRMRIKPLHELVAMIAVSFRTDSINDKPMLELLESETEYLPLPESVRVRVRKVFEDAGKIEQFWVLEAGPSLSAAKKPARSGSSDRNLREAKRAERRERDRLEAQERASRTRPGEAANQYGKKSKK